VNRSVQPEWCRSLTIQQQSVLFLASRGPDGIGKWHPCKDVHRAYRATVLVDAKLGRNIEWAEGTDTWHFSTLHTFADDAAWAHSAGSIVTAGVRYKTVDAAISDGRSPKSVSVKRISLTKPQKKRLIDLADGECHEYVGALTPYDGLADWGFINCRLATCQITERGIRWLKQPLGC
jgi:hypothetical protein